MYISMVLKRNRDLSLDIGSRYARYVGLAGSGLEGVEPQTKIFIHQYGVIFNQWGG